MSVIAKVKNLLKKEPEKVALPPTKPFPSLKKNEITQPVSATVPSLARSQSPAHQISSGVPAMHQASSAQFVFPELKVQSKQAKVELQVKKEPEMDVLITQILDDFKSSPDVGVEKPGSELLQPLFFEKIEHLLKESQLSKEEMNNFLQKDIFSNMREYHERKASGETYIFDTADFQVHLLAKLQQLKKAEHEWHVLGKEATKLKIALDQKEQDLQGHIKGLKELVAKHDAFEQKKLLHPSVSGEKLATVVAAQKIYDRGILVEERDVARAGASAMNSVRSEDLHAGEVKGLPVKIQPTVTVKSSFIDWQVPKDAGFCFSNGWQVCSLSELQQALISMPREIVAHHINKSTNHFSPWLSAFYADSPVTARVSRMRTADDLVGYFASLSFS